MRKIFVIYALVTCIGVLLCSCSWQKASVKEGTFDVYAPAPFTGAAFSMDEKSSVMRGSLQFRKYDKETLPLKGIQNETIQGDFYSSKIEERSANIAYKFLRYPITGSFDYFSKNRISMWGVGAGLDPSPFIRGTFGLNSRYIETGLTAYVNVGLNNSSVKLEWISHEYQGMMYGYEDYHGSIENEQREFKFHGGIGGFINFFPIKEIAISYAPFFYRPWWDDEVRDYEISFRFPYIISQYFGASVLIAKHVQLSAGATVYVGKSFKGRYWFFDSGIGFVF